MSLALPLHILAAIIWVGGMFFAHQVLRPVAVAQLEPPQRLTLWDGVFSRFFPWVWVAIALLLASGYWMIFGVYGGMGHVGLYVHIMHGLALLMIALYALVYFRFYRGLKAAVAAQNWPEGKNNLDRIRLIVGINLSLGLLTAVVATAGKYL